MKVPRRVSKRLVILLLNANKKLSLTNNTSYTLNKTWLNQLLLGKTAKLMNLDKKLLT